MNGPAREAHGENSGRDEFWEPYLTNLHARKEPWLDYSNHRVQLQSIAAALGSAGDVLGRTCLDAGCGRGQLALSLQALGAGAVTGIDVNPATIEDLQKEYPSCRWRTGSISDPSTYVDLGLFDLEFALEVLQYVPLD